MTTSYITPPSLRTQVAAARATPAGLAHARNPGAVLLKGRISPSGQGHARGNPQPVVTGGTVTNPKPLGVPAVNWPSLVFQDEFDYAAGTKPDVLKWTWSWFGGANQNNVPTSPNNVSCDGNSHVVLEITGAPGAWIGASITTNPNDSGTTGHSGHGFQFGTGHFAEARVWFPGPGTGTATYAWPAWWTDGQNWPQNGETDIAEGLTGLTSNYHVGCAGNTATDCPNNGPEPQNQNCYTDGFHVFGFDRQVGRNVVYWDGVQVRSYTTSDGGSPHYLILNIGSRSGVTHNADKLIVDYVRVWRNT